MRNSIGQEIEVGDWVVCVSRQSSSMIIKTGKVTSFGERKLPYYGKGFEARTEPTVKVAYEGRYNERPGTGVGLDRVFKLALD